MTIISGDTLQTAFHEQDWNELYLKLLYHTVNRLKYRYGLKESKESLTEKAREFVQQVLNLVFVKESRKWNIEKYPELPNFLRTVIDSHINNSFATQKSTAVGNKEFVFEQKGGSQISIQEVISTNELKSQITKILEEEGADDEEMLVFDCILEGFYKPKDIREELGISETEFGKIWRRVQRKREKIKTKLSKYGY